MTSDQRPPLPDHGARDRARDALDETIFVMAGAGAGKTKVLVDRICGLVTDPADPVPVTAIAAVTFTEKAGAEMRDRIRAELSERAVTCDPARSALARAALADLDLAAIGTLHSFAARLLMEQPIEAGLPPVIRPLDEVASSVRSDGWWSGVQQRLLEQPATSAAMQVLLAAGLRREAIRVVALRMAGDWDQLVDRGPGPTTPSPLVLDLAEVGRAVTALRARRHECSDPADLLVGRISGIADWWVEVESAVDDFERLALLEAVPSVGRSGRKGNWPDVEGVRQQAKDLAAMVSQVRARFVAAASGAVVAELAREVLAEAQARRRAGELQFQDLLVLARDMLRTSRTARMAAHGRYRRILLDEFQDTDPLQIEIATRIVAGEQGDRPRWQDCPVPPGSLFVVGDPKQSIYRFRRADITTYLAAQEAASGGGPAVLSTNFRSHPELLAWVNHVFGRLIDPVDGGQPAYQPLDPDPGREEFHRDLDPRSGADTRVRLIGAAPLPDEPRAEELRAIEAGLVADAIADLLREAPAVEARAEDGWASRPMAPGDVALLIPARTSIIELERALDARNVPYRTEASSLVYRSDEVRDLLLAARAVDDPSDALALVEVLRSPLFGCGDDDLVAWRAAGGRFSVFAPRPEAIDPDHPVAESLAFLGSLARRRTHLAPSELLAAIVAERRALEVATDTPLYRESWRRIRYVVDQARAWSEAEHGSLREFLTWAALQAEDEERANEIVLPERDVDAIRILTVHAAKGLEFPVVVLSGMTTKPPCNPSEVLWPQGTGLPLVDMGRAARSTGWEEAADREKQMLHLEAMRLMYVAATRAESRLLVSTVRGTRAKGLPEDRLGWTRAELLADAAQGADHSEWEPEPGVPLGSVARAVTGPMPWPEWVAVRDSARAAADRREADTVTDIAHGVAPAPPGFELPPGLRKEPQDLELPPWLKGRYGAAVGRAVHGTLQTVDLVTGEGLDGIAEAQALAEAVTDRVDAVRALARAGWAAPTVREAAAREHHKETYVGAVIGDQLVEGYIDLLYRDDDGSLVIIDYKTESAPALETVQAYQAQLAVYARALAEATGDPVSRCVLVFCREGRAAELEVPMGA